MQAGTSSPPNLFEIIAIALSGLSLITAIWAALSAKKQAQVATNQYKLSIEQHRHTLFSNIVIYNLQDRYSLLDRQLSLGITNAGQVPIVNIQIRITHGKSYTLVCDSTIPILHPQEAKILSVGDFFYRFLEKINAIIYTPAGHKINSSQPIEFTVECKWRPSVTPSSGTDTLFWKLVFRSTGEQGDSRTPVFDISLEVSDENRD